MLNAPVENLGDTILATASYIFGAFLLRLLNKVLKVTSVGFFVRRVDCG